MTRTRQQHAIREFERGQEKLDAALDRVLSRMRLLAKRRVAWLRKLWAEEGAPGGTVAVTHAEIDTYLDNRDSPEAEAAWFASDAGMKQLNYEIDRLEAAIAADTKSRFAQLHALFDISPAESDLLQLCLAPALDPALSRVYAYLHDHAGRGYATAELAARLFGHVHRSHWSPESALRRWGLVRQYEVGSGEPARLICDPFICDWLAGEDYLDERLAGISRFQDPLEPLKNWPMSETASTIKELLQGKAPQTVRLHITGPSSSGRRTFAAGICSRLGLPLLAIDTDLVDDQTWHTAFLHAQRQAYLERCALAWHGENPLRRAWPVTVPLFPLQFVIAEAAQQVPPVPGVADLRVELPELSQEERRLLWRHFVPQSESWESEEFDTLVSQHRVQIGEIASAARQNIQSAETALTFVRESNRKKLDSLAQMLECPFTWDDIVVPDHLRDTLEDLAFEARERVEFWEQPKRRRLFPQGRGLLTLFSGPPGTGKTMAAQVIAASLGLDVFRVDLSAVVSKYVGETSQNLERILSRAATMDIVLLFDEADALFGKRTEIKDAHDRFANTDTGYLLQAVENYRGVAILATNRKSNIDPAFLRRIRYVLEFPKPNSAQRGEIWRKIAEELAGPEHTKKLEHEVTALAEHLELTGAQIKFAILTALFVARRDRRPMGLTHLLRGVERELMKEGRVLSGRERDRLRSYAKG